MANPKTPQRKVVKELYDARVGQQEILAELHRRGFKDIQTIGGLKALLSRMAEKGEIVRDRRKKPEARSKIPQGPAEVEKVTPAREKKESYPFSFWSGLLNEKHYKDLGKGLWDFCLLINMVTKEVEYKGKIYGFVYGGQEVSTTLFAKRFGRSARNTKPILQNIREKGYALGLRGRHGYIYVIPHSKKWKKDKILHSGDPGYSKYAAILDKIVIRKRSRSDKSSTSKSKLRSDGFIRKKGCSHHPRSDESITPLRTRAVDIVKILKDTTTTQRTLFVVVDSYFKKHYKEKFNPKVLVDLIKLNEDLVKYNYKRIPAKAGSWRAYFVDSILYNGGEGYKFSRDRWEKYRDTREREKNLAELDRKYGEEYLKLTDKEVDEKGHVETSWTAFLKLKGVKIENEK